MKYIISLFVLTNTIHLFAQSMKPGDSLVNIGQYQQAITEYKKERKPELYKIAKAYEALDNYEEAILFYEKIREKDTLNLKVNFQYALALLHNNDIRAIQVLEHLVEKNESDIYYYYLGLAYEKQKNYTKAIENWQASRKLNPDYFKSVYKLSLQLANMQQLDTSLEIANAFLENHPNNIDILKIRGQIYYIKKKNRNCIKDFEKVVEKNSADDNILEKLANAYYNTKDYKKAITLYTELIENYNPENPNFYFKRGKCYGFLYEIRKAEEDINKSIELRAYTFDNEYFYLGYFYQQQAEYDKALSYYKKTLSCNNNHSEAAYQTIAIKDYHGQSPTILVKEYQDFLEKFSNISEERKQQIVDRITELEEK